MTRAIFYRAPSHRFVGFSVRGHAGYAPEGSDIVCAAVSACTELVLNQLCDSFGFDADCTVDPDGALVECILSRSPQSPDYPEAACLLLDGFYRTVSELASRYPRFLKCTITEV